MNKKKFTEELIELLYKYDLSVAKFLKLINKDAFWIGEKFLVSEKTYKEVKALVKNE